jgi:hypothetical protein
MSTTGNTYWKAYNAVTEYLTHHQGRNEYVRFENRFFGENARKGSRALKVAMQMATK